MRHGDDSRGATLLKLKSEMLSYHQILKRFLAVFGSTLHIKSKSIERASQRHIIRVISTSNEGDMSIAKSVRRLIAGRSPRIGKRPPKVAFGQILSRSIAQTWRTTARFGLALSFGPILGFQRIFQWVSNYLGFINVLFYLFAHFNSKLGCKQLSLFKGAFDE